jgi:hypothetical protein
MSGVRERSHLSNYLTEIKKFTHLTGFCKFQIPSTKFQTNSNDPNSKWRKKMIRRGLKVSAKI